MPKLNRAGYDAYLKSEQWGRRKAAALKRAEYRCQICNRGLELHVHHRTYSRVADEEEERDLIVLCRICHALFHSHLRLLSSGAIPKTSDEMEVACLAGVEILHPGAHNEG